MIRVHQCPPTPKYSTANGFKRFTQYLTAEAALLLSSSQDMS
eukprot:COSAG06_NODE_66710_length_253_cov_1.681818_2_plen_41_part_01